MINRFLLIFIFRMIIISNFCTFNNVNNFANFDRMIVISLLFFILVGINCQWEGMQVGVYDSSVKSQIMEQHFYYYDTKGSLIVNASVPGSSPPIVIDFKKYYPTCSNNVYYAFIFTVDLNLKVQKSICSEGLTICYDGQLVGAHMREEFNLTNVDTDYSKEFVNSCSLANGNKSIAEARALTIALQAFNGIENARLQLDNANFKKLKNGTADDVYYFFQIKASFFETEYYFLAPEDGTIMLQIGDQKSLYTRITDSEDNDLLPVTFDYKNKTYGKIKTFDVSKLDLNEGYVFRENAGLWMLYMDFKSDYRSWQIISTIHPTDEICEMLLEIRGNRVEKCRTYFEDIAVIEPFGTNYTVDYTMETGIIKAQMYGQEDAKEIATRIKRSIMQANTYKTTDQFKSEDTTTMEDIIRELRVSENSTSESTVTKGEFKFQLNIPIPSTPVSVMPKGSIAAGKEHTKFETRTERNQTDKIFRNTNRMFSDITRSQAMMEKMKSTSGAAQSMKHSEILNTKQSFLQRESTDFHVELPPDTKVIIKQLMFECDGNIIKLPYTYYTDGKEFLNLNGTTGPKYTQPVIPSWINTTSGMDPAKANFKNFISLDPMTMTPIANEKMENEKKMENIEDSQKTNDELMDEIFKQNKDEE